MDITVDLINGLTLGVEHLSGDAEDEDDMIEWAIAFHFFVIRVCLVKLKPEE